MNPKLIAAYAGGIALLLGGGAFLVSRDGNGSNGGVAPASDIENTAAVAQIPMNVLNGEVITLADYVGNKPVILDFFATWCPNCKRDMPKLNRWYKKYQDDVEVIGINLQEREGVVANYISSAGIDFPIVLDPSRLFSRAFGIRYTNTHVLIDRAGNVVQVVSGDIRESQIVNLIEN